MRLPGLRMAPEHIAFLLVFAAVSLYLATATRPVAAVIISSTASNQPGQPPSPGIPPGPPPPALQPGPQPPALQPGPASTAILPGPPPPTALVPGLPPPTGIIPGPPGPGVRPTLPPPNRILPTPVFLPGGPG